MATEKAAKRRFALAFLFLEIFGDGTLFAHIGESKQGATTYWSLVSNVEYSEAWHFSFSCMMIGAIKNERYIRVEYRVRDGRYWVLGCLDVEVSRAQTLVLVGLPSRWLAADCCDAWRET